ncbi:MAG: DUF2007 domain-containing protein [Alishewanella sp.]|nr:DUF2007 domain-containing protein [Alishewanella sp.]MDP5035387.1 DUF2007 domain-containing protein [Alishewanella sp.]MDP5187860.1 DUF2007 domain-containing protein [Alishewanella sp.]
MQIVFRAHEIIEAHIVAGMLQAHDIPAHVGGHYLQGAIGDIGTMGFANVFVADEDMPRAEQLLKDYQAAEIVEPTAADWDETGLQGAK